MNKTKYLFESFLENEHHLAHPEVLDDDLPDHFDNWLTSLDGEELIEFGNRALEIAFKIK